MPVYHFQPLGPLDPPSDASLELKAWWNKRMRLQNYRCAICRGSFDSWLRQARPAIDHDHACLRCGSERHCSKCRRGLLCTLCNTGLGMFKDDPQFLRCAAAYLELGGDPELDCTTGSVAERIVRLNLRATQVED
jgi:Recombination endonuclease VII